MLILTECFSLERKKVLISPGVYFGSLYHMSMKLEKINPFFDITTSLLSCSVLNNCLHRLNKMSAFEKRFVEISTFVYPSSMSVDNKRDWLLFIFRESIVAVQQSSISIASLFLPELKTIQYALHFLQRGAWVLVGMTDSIFSPFAMSAFENSLLLFCVYSMLRQEECLH